MNIKLELYISFDHLLHITQQKNTNEEILKNIIDSLLKPAYPIAILIGTDGLKATVRKKLNESQKQGLDFLKKGLNNKALLSIFLMSNENKIKMVLDDYLDYIDSELSTCSGDDVKKIYI